MDTKQNSTLRDTVQNVTDILDNATKHIQEGNVTKDTAIIFMALTPTTEADGKEGEEAAGRLQISVYGSERSAVELLARGMKHNKQLASIMRTAVLTETVAFLCDGLNQKNFIMTAKILTSMGFVFAEGAGRLSTIYHPDSEIEIRYKGRLNKLDAQWLVSEFGRQMFEYGKVCGAEQKVSEIKKVLNLDT